MAGVKGSFDMLGKLSGSLLTACAWKEIDLMKTICAFSGWKQISRYD